MRVACVRCSRSPRSPLPQRRSLSIASLWPALLLVISLSLVAPFVSGCGGASINVDLNTIAAIGSPASSVRVNQTLQLTSSYLASGQAMTFYVNGIAGGNATVGTITNAGVYTAPAVVPNPYSVQITSSIAKYPNCRSRLRVDPGLEPDSRPRRQSLRTDSPRERRPSRSTARNLFMARRSVGTAHWFPPLLFPARNW